MKCMRRLALATIAVSLISCSSGPSAPSNTDVRVTGRVIDFATNAGVSGARVAFGDITATADASGSYTLTLPATGRFEPLVDGAWMGISRPTAPTYRGDLVIHGTGCVARYGIVSDAATHRPIAGAMVTLAGTTTTDADGWYRMDFGCPPNGLFGFNTIAITVAHPLYADGSESVGRGIFGVSRLDVEMQRR
jgi:hypothetical protein